MANRFAKSRYSCHCQVGSGKTLGHLVPGFIRLTRLRNNPRLGATVLVLSPTRELTTQIQDEAMKFGRSTNISCTIWFCNVT